MKGTLDRTTGINPSWQIRVDGFPEMRFIGYSKATAIRRYRQMHGLKGKRIEWVDFTRPGMPQNLYDAVMMVL